MPMDSYEEFLKYFSIYPQSFLRWGIEATIFPEVDQVMAAWTDLKKRVFEKGTVRIRGYGRNGHATQLYLKLYQYLFDNENIVADPTNNAVPHRLIEKVTGLKRNKDIINYQVSHIWGHTKNVFLFEAAWNLCYTPKIMDPFTGHESKGILPGLYQKLFLETAFKKYSVFVEDYNRLIKELDVQTRLRQFVREQSGCVAENVLGQFAKDAAGEWSPIEYIDFG